MWQLIAFGILVTHSKADDKSYGDCLNSGSPRIRSPIYVSFIEPNLWQYNRCEQLSRTDCLQYAEAFPDKCFCLCRELIDGWHEFYVSQFPAKNSDTNFNNVQRDTPIEEDNVISKKPNISKKVSQVKKPSEVNYYVVHYNVKICICNFCDFDCRKTQRPTERRKRRKRIDSDNSTLLNNFSFRF